MSEPLMDVIPADRRELARAALSPIVGSAPIVGVRSITGGVSGALIYRVDTAASAYLLRMETRRDALRNPHQYVCMQTAAAAGIAPRLHHVDPEAGVAIMDFVPARPLTEYPGGSVALARDLGSLIARLQATPLFPQLRDYFVLIERMLTRLREAGGFAKGLLDPHAEGLARIREAYTWDASQLVSSHNDPNPRNIIFDGTRLWLVDWETAYRNDPLVDVAILAENVGTTLESTDALLHAWLGRAPDDLLRARLVLMRTLTRLYYAALVLITLPGGARATIDESLETPTPADFRAAIAEGRLRLGAPDAMRIFGKMLLAGFHAGLQTSEFERAITVATQA